MSSSPTFCRLCTAGHHENIENPSLQLEREFESGRKIYFSGTALNHSVHRKFLEVLKFFPRNFKHTQEKDKQDESFRGEFYQQEMVNFIYLRIVQNGTGF